MTRAAPCAVPRLAPTAAIGRHAIGALYAELALAPKPGLVSPHDRGAHHDMDMRTFMRSLFALRHYYREVAAAGARAAPFVELQRLGVEAEQRMVGATGGANTHRGAIFSLGLLAAAAGQLTAAGAALTDAALRTVVRDSWGASIRAATPHDGASHGARAVARYRVGGARAEAAAGFPRLFGTALPVLRSTLCSTGDWRRALVQTLFALMSELDDTNVLHRGGPSALAFVRRQAREFLRRGGVHQVDWRAAAFDVHEAFKARHLSPGGSADLLAAAIFVKRLQESA